MSSSSARVSVGVPHDDQVVRVLRRQLEAQLREREALIAELGPRAAPHIDQVAWSTTQSSLGVIDQITAALARISAGTFGVCARCDGQIPRERLEIVPYAERCVPCQQAG